MQPSPATLSSDLARSLAALLDLERRAREAQTEPELGFLLVNETHQITPYRQAVLWFASGGISAMSGLVRPEANAPYSQWATTVCRRVASSAGIAPHCFDSQAIADESLREQWSDWWPESALWIPLCPGAVGKRPTGHDAGLLLLRQEAFEPREIELLREWAGAWWHALSALRQSQRGRWWGLFGGTRSDRSFGRSSKRHWGLAALIALAVIAALPVRLSVLAPGELIPSRPMVVRAPLDGVLDSFSVEPNEVVKAGQTLFRFDESLLRSRLEIAQQALNAANTEFRQTMQQAVSDPRVRIQLATLSGRIEERKAELTYLSEQLARAAVQSPIDGIVLFDDPQGWIGKPVTIGERILRVAAPTDVEIEAWLPIADAIRLAPDAPVQLFLNARPLEPLSATLRYVAHEAIQRPDGTFAYRVRATLDHRTDHQIGLKGTARLEGERVSIAFWILRRPIASLRTALGL